VEDKRREKYCRTGRSQEHIDLVSESVAQDSKMSHRAIVMPKCRPKF